MISQAVKYLEENGYTYIKNDNIKNLNTTIALSKMELADYMNHNVEKRNQEYKEKAIWSLAKLMIENEIIDVKLISNPDDWLAMKFSLTLTVIMPEGQEND